MALFQSERFDPATGADMTWTIPAPAGAYQVRLYFAEIYFTQAGQRVFNVTINGTQVLTNYDTVADVKAFKGVVKTFPVTTTAASPTITITFGHVTENPSVKGVEVDQLGGSPNQLGVSPTSLTFPSTNTGTTAAKTVTLTNLGATGDPSITVNSASVSGNNAGDFSTSFSTTPPIVLAPGASTTMTVTYAPKITGPESATVTVTHTGTNTVTVPVSGTGASPPAGVIAAVNAGGPALAASGSSPAWSADTAAAPSSFVNAAASASAVSTTSSSIDMSDPSIPPGTPMALFQSERYDPPTGSDMVWTFPAAAGSYQVRLYFAEIYFTQAGQRVFNVTINGTQVLTNYDTVADVKALKGVVKTFPVTTTTANPTITITFGHVTENPSIKGIEIDQAGSRPNFLSLSTTSVGFGSVPNGQPTTSTLTLTNVGANGDPSITLTGLTVSGADASQFDAEVPRVDPTGKVQTGPPVTIAAGASLAITVWFAPATGARSATLTVASTASNSSQVVNLSGTGQSGNPVGFGKSQLAGTATGVSGDVVRFGPDGRLYVGEFGGLIHAYTIARNGANNYSVTATETIDLIEKIPNHDDDGTLNPSVTTRMITGFLMAGTATNPRIYVTSSDPRIGGQESGVITNVDTNASMLSRLDRTNGTWTRTDLVRGLPRSEETHAANGMALDPATNSLYIAQGGNTNEGAPSHNFNYLPEYAYSAAILKVDLNAIGNTTFDLPTLTDSNLPNLTGPFGGDFGRRQAKIVAGSPVQVYAPGFRTAYDVILTRSGRLYATDNGGNEGWGDVPVGNGTNACTNATSEPGTTDLDTLHLITGPGYYGGHPNPTRGNMANTFGGQSPVLASDPQECTYLKPGSPSNPAITTFDGSSNGIAEYTAGNFAGAMNGDLLVVNWNSAVYDVKLDSSTGLVQTNQILFSGVSVHPISVATQGDGLPFRGVVFVVDQVSGNILVFEPNDFSGTAPSCSGVSNGTDEDNDGFTNADEIANHTNPCSAGSLPHDWNGNHVSDLLDPNTDGDALPDVSDPFALDASGGVTTTIPFAYTWANGVQSAQCAPTPVPSGCPGGLLNMGFTGLMNNGNSKYLDQFEPSNMTAGGAAGVLTVDKVPQGDALGATNTQQYGFQFGVKTAGVGTFTTHTRLMAPFAGIVPQGNQSFGLYIGTGDQDNYFKVVATANGGSPGIQAVQEVGGVVTAGAVSPVTLPSAAASAIDLYITVTPSTGNVQVEYQLVDPSGTPGPYVVLPGTFTLPTSWFSSTTKGMAIGVIATSSGGPTFSATWKGIDASLGSPVPLWQSLAAAPTSRQEVSEVYSPTTKKFYVAGGLQTAQEAYDPSTNTWSTVASLPAALDHIQSVALGGKIYYIGGLSCWPNCSVGTVYIYDPSTDTFSTGAPMPTGRDRGAGGVAVFNGKIYYAGGLHNGTDVGWFDVYDPVANTWSSLADMPEVRDHFHAAVIGSRFYAIGGRRSDQSLDATTAVNDAFDFTTNTWVTGLAPLPTPRGGFAVGAIGTKITVIGGEGGNQAWTTVETYDTASNAWTTGTPMPTARHGIEGAVCNGGIYIADGGTVEGSGGATNVNQAYFPSGTATACT
jgi:N-acetylneuraminic acid mutarotase